MHSSHRRHAASARLAGVFAALLLAACSSFTDLDDFAVLENTVAHSGESDRVSVTAGAGRIDLAGVVSTATPCYDVFARIRRAGRSLTVRVLAARRDGMCVAAVARRGYEAHIGGLAPGDYHLTVVHQAFPSDTPVVFDGPVRVER